MVMIMYELLIQEVASYGVTAALGYKMNMIQSVKMHSVTVLHMGPAQAPAKKIATHQWACLPML